MASIQPLIASYGLWVLFLIGLAEFAGLPLAGAPMLVAVGGLARTTLGVDPMEALFAVSAGGLVSDLAWFGLARWQGRRLIGFACGLAGNPGVCAARVSRRVALKGTAAFFLAKFVPGAGAVPAIAAGLGRLPLRRFLWADSAALLLWASTYLGGGWLLGEHVEGLIEGAALHSSLVGWALAFALITAVAWRLLKQHLHRRAHADLERISVSSISTGDPCNETGRTETAFAACICAGRSANAAARRSP